MPRTRRAAAAALIVFLIGVLPANIHAAREQPTIGGAAATALWPRVALQLLLRWIAAFLERTLRMQR